MLPVVTTGDVEMWLYVHFHIENRVFKTHEDEDV